MIMVCGIVPLGAVADIDFGKFFSVKAASTLAPTGQCGKNVYWTFDESTGLLTISGTGDMRDFDIPPFNGNSSIKSVVIENDVTSIGDDAFVHCEGLTSITIGNSVTNIGYGAFSGSGLTSITIPDSVRNIDISAFEVCDKLKDVYYSGTEKQWNEITIEDKNDPLLNANIHFMGTDVPAQSNVFKVKYKETAKFKPQIAMVDNEAYTVTYTPSDTSVATVDKDGNITTVHKGTVDITCTVTDASGNVTTETCTINVKFSFGQWLIWFFLLGFLWY